jgi:DNA-directed RNA polymerase
VTTDLKSIWAREKQVIFSETPLSQPEEASGVLKYLNQQTHVVGEDFTYQGSIHINRDFQLQWFKMSLSPGDRFYLDHFMDFRGRIYPKGHILTYQGTDFQKSLIRCEPYDIVDSSQLGQQLRDALQLPPRPETMSPRQWLMVDVARSYGLDKNTWLERLRWAQAHPDVLPGAKEPFLYASALKGSQELITDHLVSLDATASGIQCLALMAQDEDSALAVNLGTDEVRNPYQRVKEHMGDYAYQQVKQATMTLINGVSIQ